MAGLPWASGGTGTHCHGISVESTHKMRLQTRDEPRVPGGPRWGIARCGKIQASNSGAESWTGLGVVAGLWAVVLIRQGPQGKPSKVHWRSGLLQRLQE